jgi:rod shape-determining protein MreD
VNPRLRALLRVSAVVVVALVVQESVGADLRVLGVAPDLLLLVTIAAALVGGVEMGTWTGFAAGLLADLSMTTTPVGLEALSWCLVGWAVGSLRTRVLTDARATQPTVAAAATVGGLLLFLVIGELVGQTDLVAPGRSFIIKVVVIEAAWNAVAVIPVAALVGRAARGAAGADRLRRPDSLGAR